MGQTSNLSYLKSQKQHSGRSEQSINDLALVSRSLRGEVEAFNQLILTYQGLAYNVAFRTLQDEEAAADAIQESFIKAFRALEGFQGGSFKSWLMRIVVNTCYDFLRAQKRRPTDSLDRGNSSRGNFDNGPIDDSYSHHLIDKSEGPEAYAERMELNRQIEEGIRTLPSDQRMVLVLCDVHGYSYEEISETTGIPMGTVKSRISRGRAKLRDYLKQRPELLPSIFRPKSR